jgi:hypothetical protein
MPQATSEITDKKILIWRPEVHKHFSENLYYFLFSFRDFSRALLNDFTQNLTNTLNLPGFCLYSIFGYYDCLLRVWLNPVAYERFWAEIVKKNPYHLSKFVEFLVNDQKHWALRAKELRPADISRSISFHSASDFEKAQMQDADTIGRLKNAGLLTIETTWWPRDIKFYLSISELPPMAASNRDNVIRRLQDTLEQFKEKRGRRYLVHHTSMYLGSGFCSILIKGISANIPILMDLAQTIREDVADYSLSTATFVIGKLVGQEKDDIQPGSLGQEYVFDNDVHAWIPELYAPGRPQLRAEMLREIEAFLKRPEINVYRNLDFDSRSWLGHFVVALIRQSVSESTGAPDASDILSSWFREMESWFRDRLPDYLVALAKGDSRKQAQIAHRYQIPKDTRFVPFGDMMKYILDLAKNQYDNSRNRPEFLSSEAHDYLNNAAFLRNLVQHNDVQYLSDWQTTIDIVAKALPVLTALRQEIKQSIQQSNIGQSNTKD